MIDLTTCIPRCDLCGYGGPFARPQDFTHVGPDLDLCFSCTRPAGAWIACGTCTATFSEDRQSWSCSCGTTSRDVWPYFLPPELVAVVPSLAAATATAHVEGRRLPAPGSLSGR